MASPVKLQAEVIRVTQHSVDVYSYLLRPQGRVPKFRPGQFMHLALDPYMSGQFWPESRVFSIASSPSCRREELALTMAVKGAFTQRIADTLHVGSVCWLKLPYGSFIIPSDIPVVLVAGGVGITPFVSFLEYALEVQLEQSITLHYGIRTASLYLYDSLISQCQQVLSCFDFHSTCEDGSGPGTLGILSLDRIVTDVRGDSLVFLSGPPAMISSFQIGLLEQGVSRDRIRVDDWE